MVDVVLGKPGSQPLVEGEGYLPQAGEHPSLHHAGGAGSRRRVSSPADSIAFR